MTVTVLDRTWELEVWPAGPDQSPNAVYLALLTSWHQSDKVRKRALLRNSETVEAKGRQRASIVQARSPEAGLPERTSLEPGEETVRTLSVLALRFKQRAPES